MAKNITTFFRKPPEDSPIKKENITGKIAILRKYGNITEIATPIDTKTYLELSTQYKGLVTEIKNSNLPKETRKELSFELHECQAIIAFRAKNFDNCTQCLVNTNKNYTPGRDKLVKVTNTTTSAIIEKVIKADFTITELEILTSEYLKLKSDTQDKSPQKDAKLLSELKTLTASLINDLTTVVESKLKEGKYSDAIKELDYLQKHSTNLQVFLLYTKSCIMAEKFQDILDYYQEKFGNCPDEDVARKQEISKCYKNLAEALSKAENTEKYVLEANSKASEFYQETAPVDPKILVAQQKFNQAHTELVVTKSEVDKLKVQEQVNKELKAEIARLTAQSNAAEAALKQQIEEKAAAELAMQGQPSSTIVKANLVQPSTPPLDRLTSLSTQPSAPPAYTDILSTKPRLYPVLDDIAATNTQTMLTTSTIPAPVTAAVSAPVTAAVTAAVSVSEEIKETIKGMYEALIGHHTDKVKKLCDDITEDSELCNNVIKAIPTIHNDTNGSRLLIDLVSSFLFSKQLLEVEKACHEAINLNNNVYKQTSNIEVLRSLANVYKGKKLHEPFIKSSTKLFYLDPTICEKTCAIFSKLADSLITEKPALAIKAFQLAENHSKDVKQKALFCLSKAKIHLASYHIEKVKEETKKAMDFNSKLLQETNDLEGLQCLAMATNNYPARYKFLSKKLLVHPEEAAAELKELAMQNNELRVDTASLMKAFPFFRDLLPQIMLKLRDMQILSYPYGKKLHQAEEAILPTDHENLDKQHNIAIPEIEHDIIPLIGEM
ncbi:hypothetical protein [Candidatus Tisiphia endosymbiont of Hybos culiciformis]|uniref:hypothetical protein n=1 Tax=Candidatus Tisiphia endosymbiont of Hybos culiciformis TaxID=3139331 RepID=UPI003CCB1E24